MSSKTRRLFSDCLLNCITEWTQVLPWWAKILWTLQYFLPSSKLFSWTHVVLKQCYIKNNVKTKIKSFIANTCPSSLVPNPNSSPSLLKWNITPFSKMETPKNIQLNEVRASKHFQYDQYQTTPFKFITNFTLIFKIDISNTYKIIIKEKTSWRCKGKWEIELKVSTMNIKEGSLSVFILPDLGLESGSIHIHAFFQNENIGSSTHKKNMMKIFSTNKLTLLVLMALSSKLRSLIFWLLFSLEKEI